MTPPSGVVISDGAITGNYDTASSWPLNVDLISSITIDSITIDDTPATLTEGVLQVPYTAQAITIVATANTAKGPETHTYEYTVDVDHVAVRPYIANIEARHAAIDYNTGAISGDVIQNYLVVEIKYNGSFVTWTNRSRCSYRVKFGEGDWSEYIQVGVKYSNHAGIDIKTGTPAQIQFKYTYSGTSYESIVYDIQATADYPVDDTIILGTTHEGLTIDNEARTITGTVAAADSVTIYTMTGEDINSTSAVISYYNTTQSVNYTSTVHESFTGSDIAKASYINGVARKVSGGPVLFFADYTVSITIAE